MVVFFLQRLKAVSYNFGFLMPDHKKLGKGGCVFNFLSFFLFHSILAEQPPPAPQPAIKPVDLEEQTALKALDFLLRKYDRRSTPSNDLGKDFKPRPRAPFFSTINGYFYFRSCDKCLLSTLCGKFELHQH